MGHDRERFTFVAPPELICPTCLEVFKDPVKVCLEDHIFCRGCYQSYQDEQVNQLLVDPYTARAKDTCAICRAGKVMKGERTQNAKFVARIVGRLQVSCSNVSFGCGWKGELANEPDHLVSCEMRIIICYNGRSMSGKMLRHEDYINLDHFDDGGEDPELCEEAVRANHLMQHKRYDCEYQQLVCPRGGKKCIYLRFEKHEHPEKCVYHKCKVVKNCPTIGTLSALAIHEPYCAKVDAELQSLRSMSTLQTEYSDLYGRVGGLEQEVLDLEDDISELRDENYDLKVALEEMEWEKHGYKSEVETWEEKIEDLEYYPSDMLAQVYAHMFQAKADSLDFDHRIAERDETIERLQNELDRLVPCPLTEEEAEALTEIVSADFGITIGKRVREIVKEGEEEEEDLPFKVARIA